MREVIAYTDGSCYWRTRQGGWGLYLTYVDEDGTLIHEKEVYEQCEDTTIGRMEIVPIIKAIELLTPLKKNINYSIVSDSEYAINTCHKQWFLTWQAQNWEGRKNADLWKRFYGLFVKYDLSRIKFIHTRGHNKGSKKYIRGNNIADRLAGKWKSEKTYYPYPGDDEHPLNEIFGNSPLGQQQDFW